MYKYEGAKEMKKYIAKYRQICTFCNQYIEEGEEIRYNFSYKHMLHEKCSNDFFIQRKIRQKKQEYIMKTMFGE